MGFPIRKSPDITPVCGSPKLIAACHVLHRLILPRHPPCALSSLTIELTPAQGRITSVLCGWLTYLRLEIDRAHHALRSFSPKDTLHNFEHRSRLRIPHGVLGGQRCSALYQARSFRSCFTQSISLSKNLYASFSKRIALGLGKLTGSRRFASGSALSFEWRPTENIGLRIWWS